MILLMIILFLSNNICAQDAYIHRLGIEGRAGYIFPTSSFLRGENDMRKIMRSACSAHLKYSFRLPPGTAADRVYGSSYQGIGLGYFDFGNRREMGTPVALYAFQGARIAGITPRLSLNYEWGFGASFGWKPYDYLSNPNNTVMGSKVNAYLSAGIHLNWILSPRFDLNIGATAVHFSNGNTRYPNTGLNTIDFKIGVAYNFNRDIDKILQPLQQIPVPAFPRHVSYDLMLFGSWRRKAVDVPGGQVPAPGKYGVAGFCFAPMYNFGYKFRAGVSLDGVYDASANIYTKDYATQLDDASEEEALTMYRKFPSYIEHQQKRLWQDAGSEQALMGKTALILGTGDIGTNIAKRLSAFDVYTIGIRRTAKFASEWFDEVYTLDALDEQICRADIVIGCLPKTVKTTHLLNQGRLRKMKKGGLVVNVGRGSLIVQPDLIQLLEEGYLSGAVLDVTDPEPLPSDNLLWGMKNVLITPHVSGISFGHTPQVEERVAKICAHNLKAFLNHTEMMNVVDWESGYRKGEKYAGSINL